MNQETGKYILIAGIFIVFIGIIVYFFSDYFKWIGKLPGDFRVEKENFKFYFPLTTMIILSVIATVLMYLIKKFL